MAVVLRCVFGVPRIRLLRSVMAVLVVVAGVQVLWSRPAVAADCPDERADAPAAVVTAKACAKPVEVASVRGESARTFANPDGSKTLEMSAVPQRVRRPDGSWVPGDTGLQVVPGGAVVPKATTAGVRFSGGGTGALVTFVREGREVRLSWPQPLPVPTVSGDTATYGEVLPGVDLRVRATVDGFTHVLVVKSREAAADPALRELRYGLGGPDVSVAQTLDGGLSLTAPDGTTLLSGGGAAMWDSTTPPSAPGARAAAPGAQAGGVPDETVRHTDVPMRVDGGQLVLNPDPAWLADSSTMFPAFVDPQFGTGASRWAYANSDNHNNNDGYAWVGLDPYNNDLVRSYFDFPVGRLAGTHVLSATFATKLRHSWSCTSTPAYLYRTGGFSGTPRVAWGSVGLQRYLDAQSAHGNKDDGCADNPQPDVMMYYGNNLRSDVQLAADQGWGNYSVALSAAGDTSGSGESTQNRWKKFYPGSTSLSVTYNSYPWSAWRSTAGKGCTSGAGRTVINSTQVLLSSQLTDPDGGDTVAGSFDWSADGGATWHALPITPRALGGQVHSVTADVSGTSAAFYVWRVRPWDGTDWGGYSGWCEFSVDLTPPNAAVAASTQLSMVKPDPANPQPLPPPAASAVVGQPAVVTLTPTGGDTDVAGYLYGVSKDGSGDVPVWVPASADGRVTVPVTPLWADPFVGNTLTVRAKDRAGNVGARVQYQFAANPATVPAPAKRGDVTGDGRSDLAGISDSDGQAQVRTFITAADGATVLGPTTPVSMPAGGRSVTGDFNADGHSDIAVFRDGANGHLSVTVYLGDGNGYAALPAADGGLVSSPVAQMRFVAGNFTGDTKTDVAMFYDYGGLRTGLFMFAAKTDGSGLSPAAAWWDSGSGNFAAPAAKIVAGNVDGAGFDEIGVLYDYGSCTAGMLVFTSTGTGIAGNTWTRPWYQPAADNWCWSASTPLAGDFITTTGQDGQPDHKADIAVVYNYGGGAWKVWTFSGATGLTTASITGQASSVSDANAAKFVAGDFNGDGKTDLAHFYDYGNARTVLFTLTSNGTSLGPETQRWDSGPGGLDWARFTPMY